MSYICLWTVYEKRNMLYSFQKWRLHIRYFRNRYSSWIFVLAFFLSLWAFTCSNSTEKMREQGVKSFKVNNKYTRMTSLMPFWCLHCWLWTDFTPCSGDSIAIFEQMKTDLSGQVLQTGTVVINWCKTPGDRPSPWSFQISKVGKTHF